MTMVYISCPNDHHEQFQVDGPNSENVLTLLKTVMEGRGYSRSGEKMAGLCPVCQGQLVVSFTGVVRGHTSDPDAVHKAAEDGFHGGTKHPEGR